MKVSKDLSVTRNEDNLVSIFSWSLGKTIIITDSELPLLIEALQIEYASQRSTQTDGETLCEHGKGHCQCDNTRCRNYCD